MQCPTPPPEVNLGPQTPEMVPQADFLERMLDRPDIGSLPSPSWTGPHASPNVRNMSRDNWSPENQMDSDIGSSLFTPPRRSLLERFRAVSRGEE